MFDSLISEGLAASQADNSPRAVECFERAIAVAPSAGLPRYLLAAEFAALGDMDKAESAFASAVRLAPEFAMARFQLGLLQFSSGRAELALLTWQPLRALPETDPLPHFVAGFEVLAIDQFDEALRHFQRGLALNHGNDALSGDIEKVIAGIRALAPAAGADADEGRPEAHVLLANYQQQGRPH
ncbi:tetratricopeptide repeat protein [Variovorax ginsengisoli]|uniref:Tetratricopeptide repeat protein n=1 Tax=Variovorax ginsengisoli TaxID=363844 RepID=A0ABT8SG84_9BURK|nr:tetratricopeptide repeat protein [Variovorax ginsengisoli]MDN8618027.1 tetratricopeptide repeat protein [Variovorax ginsengisoli]MDO1537197.1 tetratricopeptide repeat protein [Variovorax ginsengisoli]